MTPEEYETLNLYKPTAADAALRLELLEYLVGLGATAADLVAYRDSLPALASVIALRGGPVMNVRDVAERSGLSVDRVRTLTRAAGFPTPGPDDRVFTDGFVGIAAMLTAAESLFGEEVVLQLVRVMGAAAARLADATISAFLVNVEPAARREDPVGLAVARANAEAVELLPLVIQALDVLLRQHLIAAQRTIIDEPSESGYETQVMCVAFVDLVGSTDLGETLSTGELGAVLTEFEHLASDAVTDAGGRVVKLIGDEILFTITDAVAAGAIASRLVSLFQGHARVPPVRVGLASGAVMMRDGDVYGPVVNLAARSVALAGPNEIVAPADLVAAMGLPAELTGPRELKGFAHPIELCRIRPEGESD